MTYTSVFGGTVVYPAEVSYRAVSLTADTQLSWPTELATDTDVVAKIMNVTATAGPWELILPPADEASVGETTLVFNVGANAFIVSDNGGNTIVSIAPGLAYQIFLTDNTTANGVWRQVQYGAGTSIANAGSLVGNGIKAIGTTLNQSMPVVTISLDYAFGIAPDRAKAFVWTGGSGTLTLPLALNTGNDWFVQVRNNGTGAITLTPSGSDQINGTSSVVFNPGDSAFIVCNGAAWYTIGFGQSSDFTFDFNSIDLTSESTPYTLTGADLNRIAYNFGGTIASNFEIIVPDVVHQYWVTNGTTGGFDIEVKTALGTGITLAPGAASIMYCNGVDVVEADTGGVAFPIAIANGGTGANNATNARLNIGAAADGVNADITRLTVLTDGGASGPALTFLSESNTGIYRSGSGELSIALAGAQGASFSSSGLSLGGPLVLSTTTLGSSVVNSSLTSVGTLTSGALGAGFTTVAVGRGGTGTGTAFTAGSVVFAGASGVYSQDNANLFWGNTNKRLGIGTNLPATALHVSAANNIPVTLETTAGNHANIDYMADGGLSRWIVGAMAGGSFRFFNPIASATIMDIKEAGDIGIGTVSPTERLHVVGNIRATGIIQSTIVQETGTIEANGVGFRGIPQNSRVSGYTLALADAGKHISITTGGVTIPANSSVAFPVGTTIVVYNDSASAQNIAITTDTLRWAGTASTGTRSLLQRGLATLVKVKSTEWVASGNLT